ncbi:MAG: L,D-transpeptidase family protein [Desulfuromonadales bacterium]
MKRMQAFVLMGLLVGLGIPWPTPGFTADLLWPAIIGANRTVIIDKNESLLEIARREGFGYTNIVNSNRALDPWIPQAGEDVLLPGEAILPAGSRPGIVINLAELRLYHIPGNPGKAVQLYPLGIGRAGRETPPGHYRITVKREKPEWRVPEGLRKQDPNLPKIVPPGPTNPLGNFWLGLSAPGYGIHGTNRPYGVGRRISYGCLRMYPEDIAELYARVSIGTPVTIVYQPIKAAWNETFLLLEVHADYLQRFADPFQQALTAVSSIGWSGDIDYARIQQVVAEQRGLPEIVGYRAGR